jgi:hypothetical protein
VCITEDGNEDEDEASNNENNGGNQMSPGVQVTQMKPAVHKLLCASFIGGRNAVDASQLIVEDPLSFTRRGLFRTPKEKECQTRKATEPPVPFVFPDVDEESIKWTSIVRSNCLKKDDSMLLLKMNVLIRFIGNNCVCKHCLKSDSVIQRKTIGFATTFTHRCSCGKMARIKPDVTCINRCDNSGMMKYMINP